MTFGLVVGICPVVGINLFVGTGPVVSLTYLPGNSTQAEGGAVGSCDSRVWLGFYGPNRGSSQHVP